MSRAAEAEVFERDPMAIVDALVRLGRAAMEAFAGSDQARVDEAVTAIGVVALQAGACGDAGRDGSRGHRPRQCGGQGGQEPAQDLRHPARPPAGEERRHHRRAARARPGEVREAGRCGLRGDAVHQPCRDPCEQDDDGAQGAQCDRHRAVTGGSRNDHPCGDADADGAPKNRRAGGSGAGARRPGGQGDHPRADGCVRSRGRDWLAEQRTCRLPQRHARHRGRRGQRAGHHRFQRDARRGGGQDQRVEVF